MIVHGEEIPAALQNNPDIQLEKIFEDAPNDQKGRFVRFELDNVSYCPTPSVMNNWIKTNYLGIRPSDSFAQSPLWSQLHERKKTCFSAGNFEHLGRLRYICLSVERCLRKEHWICEHCMIRRLILKRRKCRNCTKSSRPTH